MCVAVDMLLLVKFDGQMLLWMVLLLLSSSPPCTGIINTQNSDWRVWLVQRSFAVLPGGEESNSTNHSSCCCFLLPPPAQGRSELLLVDVRLPGKGDSNSHGARPVHLIITMIKWIRTSRLSINNSLSLLVLALLFLVSFLSSTLPPCAGALQAFGVAALSLLSHTLSLSRVSHSLSVTRERLHTPTSSVQSPGGEQAELSDTQVYEP